MSRKNRGVPKQRTVPSTGAQTLPGHGLPVTTWDTVRDALVIVDGIMRRFAELPLESDRQAREVVTVGLLRRAFVAAQSIAELLFRGQVEGAIVLSRTLLDVTLTALIVTDDPTDSMARRLVGYDYYFRQKYPGKLLGDREVRAQLEETPGDKDATIARARSWKDQFGGAFFDSVRDDLLRDVKGNRGWHGLGNVEDAFRAKGRGSDYLRHYTIYSPYVHGSNIEWDFIEAREGKPFLRDPIEWGAENLRAPLGMALFRLHEVALLVIDDRLHAPRLSAAPMQRMRTEMLQAAKASLFDVLANLVAAFGPEPAPETDTPRSDINEF